MPSMETIEQKILALEEKFCGGWTPGTRFERVILDTEFAKANNVTLPDNCFPGSFVAWGLSLGTMAGVKVTGYGLTWDAALKNAEEQFKALMPKNKKRSKKGSVNETL